MRDIEWATNTCTITFNTVGIWPENADGTDVNTCDRSRNSKLLATGDDFGKVKLYSYPVTQPRVSYRNVCMEIYIISVLFIISVTEPCLRWTQ